MRCPRQAGAPWLPCCTAAALQAQARRSTPLTHEASCARAVAAPGWHGDHAERVPPGVPGGFGGHVQQAALPAALPGACNRPPRPAPLRVMAAPSLTSRPRAQSMLMGWLQAAGAAGRFVGPIVGSHMLSADKDNVNKVPPARPACLLAPHSCAAPTMTGPVLAVHHHPRCAHCRLPPGRVLLPPAAARAVRVDARPAAPLDDPVQGPLVGLLCGPEADSLVNARHVAAPLREAARAECEPGGRPCDEVSPCVLPRSATGCPFVWAAFITSFQHPHLLLLPTRPSHETLQLVRRSRPLGSTRSFLACTGDHDYAAQATAAQQLQSSVPAHLDKERRP